MDIQVKLKQIKGRTQHIAKRLFIGGPTYSQNVMFQGPDAYPLCKTKQKGHNTALLSLSCQKFCSKLKAGHFGHCSMQCSGNISYKNSTRSLYLQGLPSRTTNISVIELLFTIIFHFPLVELPSHCQYA